MSSPQLTIISGLSGSGKSSALNAFEDLDYYAIDNLPIKLLDTFMQLLTSSHEFNKVALVMDLRDHDFTENYPHLFRKILQSHPRTEILFLEASDEVLARRFSETRRRHPLSKESVVQGIQKERDLLSDLKEIATQVMDTSSMEIHQLKQRISEQFGSPESSKLQVRLLSFGFKFGLPKNCDLILDVRFLSNPHFSSELRAFSGLNQEVQEYIKKDPRSEEFRKRTLDYLNFLIPHYQQEGKHYLSVGIGCTGGRHRSVYMTEELAKGLQKSFGHEFSIHIEHQDLKEKP